MKKQIIIFCAIALTGTLPAISLADSLCSTDEKTLFACNLESSRKSVSLCQSKSNPKNIFYKFGTPTKVEITLPNGKSGKPYLHYEKFGPSSYQWLQSINFPLGKVIYSLSTPQGISVQLFVEGIRKPVSMSCGSGDSGVELSDAYYEMEELKYTKK